MEGRVGMFISVDTDTHAQLVARARDCRISLAKLHQAVLRWACEHDSKSLIGFGVSLPVWPTDIASVDPQVHPGTGVPVAGGK